MTLVWYIVIPAVAAPLAWLAGRLSPLAARAVALVGCLAPLVLVVAQVARHWSALTAPGGAAPAGGDPFAGAWVAQIDRAWIPQLGVRFALAADGLSLVLLLLTFALGVLAVLSSWRAIETRVGLFHLFLLWTVAGLAGVFIAVDLILFYFFFEMMLVPMYFLIAVWGYERRIYAAIKFFLFTQASGLLMLIAILALAFYHQAQAGGGLTFDFRELLGTELSRTAGMWLMLGFFVAFAVKLPSVPLHTWLPDAHTQAPTAASLLLAGVLIKVGAYGMLRFMVPLFPQAVADFRTAGLVLGAAGVVYGALLAWSQRDLKRLVAYTSVSHMGFVLMGVFAWNELALQGVVLEIVCHALSTGALFVLVGALLERIHTRDMEKMGGLWTIAPRFGGVWLVFALASLGLPGLGNFVAEFLILAGVWQVSHWAAVVGAVGLVFATVYALWMVQRAFQGPETHGWEFPDLGARELFSAGVMIAGLVALGFYPQPLIDGVSRTVAALRAAAPAVSQQTLRPGPPRADSGLPPGVADAWAAAPADRGSPPFASGSSRSSPSSAGSARLLGAPPPPIDDSTDRPWP